MRERWTRELEQRGPQALHAILARRAPWAAATIEPADRQRIVRSLELLDIGELEPPAGESELWTADDAPLDAADRAGDGARALYARIDARVDAMLAAGAEAEVRRANAAGASATARKALGFEELLAGDVEAMKRRTRNYARRQLTWMRKLAGVHVLDTTGRTPDEVAAEVLGAVDSETRHERVHEHHGDHHRHRPDADQHRRPAGGAGARRATTR